jgi:multidrug efflux system outer membrane protein
MKKIFFVIFILTLSGCGLYKDYTRPEDVKTFGIYGDTVVSTADSMMLSWKEIFPDTCLQHLILAGLNNNTDLRVAKLQAEEAEESLKAAKWAFVPSLSLNPQGMTSASEGNGATYTYEIPVSASWQLDVFGSLRNATHRKQAQLESAQAYKKAVQTQLVADIATYYYRLVLLDKQLRVYQETENSWRQNIEVTKRLMEAGEYSDAAVTQSEANYYSICASVIDVEQQIHLTENNLSVLLGDTMAHIVRDTSVVLSLSSTIQKGIPMYLLAARPDVRQAECNLAASFYAVNEARASFYPSITLTGSTGWSNNVGEMIVNPAVWIGSAVGSLVQPLFQQRKLRTQLNIAEKQQEEAKQKFQQTLLTAGIEVNSALTKLKSYQKKSAFYNRQVEALGRTVKSTTLLMSHGTKTYLEVLSAQQSLLSAQLTQLNNSYSEMIAIVNLYQTLGL